jgi:hypothetical protein
MAVMTTSTRGPSPSDYEKDTAILVTRRAVRVALLLLACAIVLAIVAASPLALKGLGSLHGWRWWRLSNIGQTYGAASALLTALALIGVAGSIFLQAKEINANREQSSREHHAHLVEMALEDPVYQRCWGIEPSRLAPDAFRQRSYLNLIVSHWERDYRVNGIAEHTLRGNLAQLFQGEAARQWWADTGDFRKASATSRRDKRVWRIADKEFRKAISSGPPTVAAQAPSTPVPADHRAARNALLKTGAAVLLGAIGGAILGQSYRKS